MSTWRFDPSQRVIHLYARLEGLDGASAVARLILDTGAASVVLTPHVTRRLGFEAVRAAWPVERVISAHRDGLHPRLTLPAVTVLGHRLERVTCLEMDLPPGIGADGLLGMSYLRFFRLELDAPGGMLSLHRP